MLTKKGNLLLRLTFSGLIFLNADVLELENARFPDLHARTFTLKLGNKVDKYGGEESLHGSSTIEQ